MIFRMNSARNARSTAFPAIYRGAACLFLLLYALAFARPFVPGLCQGMFAAQRDACCPVEEDSCCRQEACDTADAPQEGAAEAPRPAAERCPFCNLVIHPAVTETAFVTPAPHVPGETDYPPCVTRMASPLRYAPSLGRAPPLSV